MIAELSNMQEGSVRLQTESHISPHFSVETFFSATINISVTYARDTLQNRAEKDAGALYVLSVILQNLTKSDEFRRNV
jgi:hypothetical protein